MVFDDHAFQGSMPTPLPISPHIGGSTAAKTTQKHGFTEFPHGSARSCLAVEPTLWGVLLISGVWGFPPAPCSCSKPKIVQVMALGTVALTRSYGVASWVSWMGWVKTLEALWR